MPAGGQNTVLQTLRKRREFLDAAKARRSAAPGLVVQMHKRRSPGPSDLAEADIGVGYTASRKVGNAVQRNRAKRRMRALAQAHLPARGKAGHNYVLIARQALLDRSFADLESDLSSCLARLDKQGQQPTGKRRPNRSHAERAPRSESIR
ncbi:MAG: ribonuclease P protein component [Pseudomonadota bacterium]